MSTPRVLPGPHFWNILWLRSPRDSTYAIRSRTSSSRKESSNPVGIADTLDPLFALYASARANGEGFGDFCHRIGMPALQAALAERQKGAA